MLISLIFWTIALSLWFTVIVYVIYDGLSKDQTLYEYRDNHLYAMTGISIFEATPSIRIQIEIEKKKEIPLKK